MDDTTYVFAFCTISYDEILRKFIIDDKTCTLSLFFKKQRLKFLITVIFSYKSVLKFYKNNKQNWFSVLDQHSERQALMKLAWL